jgi:hypothetical protein
MSANSTIVWPRCLDVDAPIQELETLPTAWAHNVWVFSVDPDTVFFQHDTVLKNGAIKKDIGRKL